MMNKKKIVSSVIVLSLMAAMAAPSVYAGLSWKDGAPVKYNFTYSQGDEGIESVTVSDKNGTASDTELEVGETVTTQTGTIVWRDSYTNVTTFTVKVETGYELVGLTGANVNEDEFKDNGDGTYTFQFTDKGAEVQCFGKDVEFYLDTEKVEYAFVDEAGKTIGSAKIGEPITLKEPAEQEGKEFIGWYLNDEVVKGNLTADMIEKAQDNKITVEARYNVKEYPLTIRYYINNNDGSEYGGNMVDISEGIPVPYGTTIDDAWLTAKGYLRDDYKVIGGEGITIGTDSNTIDLVKSDPAENGAARYDYSFTYAGSDGSIESVTCSVNGSEPFSVDLNETVKVETSGWAWDDNYKVEITFKVETVGNKNLNLKSNDGEKVSINEDGSYSFVFTRTGTNVGKTAHINFSLSTNNAE